MNFETIHIVDDDELVCISTEAVLKAEGYATTIFSSGESFLAAAETLTPGCVLLDVRMGGMSGIEVLKQMRPLMGRLPVVMMSGHGDISMALQAVRLGAMDFIEKPFTFDIILQAIRRAAEIHAAEAHAAESHMAETQAAETQAGETNGLQVLSEREREILILLVQGDQNKVVARKLGISHRTVEVHRARIMHKTGAENFAELMKIAIASGLAG